jgi:hypothetical protein
LSTLTKINKKRERVFKETDVVISDVASIGVELTVELFKFNSGCFTFV